jgi:hypothetical protein
MDGYQRTKNDVSISNSRACLWPVQKKEVDVLNVQASERLLEGLAYSVMVTISIVGVSSTLRRCTGNSREFSSNIELAPRDTRVANSIPNLLFISVACRLLSQ